jgi:DNA-binding LacI/PurR family transcriptional regulator
MSSDDAERLGAFEPRLSAGLLPGCQIGSRPAGLLLKRMEKAGRKCDKAVLPPELRIRESLP